MNRYSVSELAELVGGTLLGDPSVKVVGAAPLEVARADRISFLQDPKQINKALDCPARALVIPEELSQEEKVLEGRTCIVVADPLSAFVRIFRHIQARPEPGPHGIDPLASIHPSAKLGEGCSIHPFAVVGEGCVLGDRCRLYPGAVLGDHCKLGDDVTLHPNVVLYDHCELGHRVIIHANAVLGADGYGYRFRDGHHEKVPQLGHVEVGDDVEIGAGTTIDRGTFQATTIGAGTKIDNQVQIAHNCRVGDHNLIVSQVGMAGSCTTESHVVLAGQVGIADHVHLGQGAVVGAGSGLMHDVPAGAHYFGRPAKPDRDEKRIMVSLVKLPEVVKEVRSLKARVDQLESGDQPTQREAS